MRLLFVHPTHLRGASGSSRNAVLSRSPTSFELLANLTEAFLPVLELTARLPASHHDPCGQMTRPYGGVGRVYALASGTMAAKRFEHAGSRELIKRQRRHFAVLPPTDGRIAHAGAPGPKSAGRDTIPPPRHTTPSYTTHDWPGATACTRSEKVTRAPHDPIGSTSASLNGPV